MDFNKNIFNKNCFDNVDLNFYYGVISMFIGRKEELDTLNTIYQKNGFDMVVMYGRRRIGKSTLLAEFIKDKKAIFFTATKVGADRNLELMSRQTAAVLDPSVINVSFPTVEDLFDFITARMTDEKLIIVIDELPYWAEKDEALLSIIQKYIDTSWLESNLMLILCGSALSFMEDKVLSEKSPVFGRRTAQIKLEAFDYLEAAEFVPNYTYEEKAICYGVTGGVAKYLSLFDPDKSLDDNIKEQFFNKAGYLFDETRNLLTQEFNDITPVNNVIERIASGSVALNIIADKVHEKEATVTYTLKKLMSVGLVDKKLCITEEKNKKKVQYILKDHMFRFWYSFIPQAYSLIELGAGASYYDAAVKPKLHTYMSYVFEDMCRYYTLKAGVNGTFGTFITSVGNWWGNEVLTDSTGKKYQQTADIDVVGISDIDKTFVVGECKFRNENADKNVYDTLVRRSNIITSRYSLKKLLIFSLGGFTKWFDECDDERLMLIGLKDMYEEV